LIIESIVAFLLIISAASIIYLLGRRVAPKPVQSDAERSAYACGEKVAYPKLKVNVSLYKYLIYFVVLDSSVILLAFATFMSAGINVPLILIYLAMMLAAGLLLLDWSKKP
jgi:NADH:ubiquinone oxidoreductase subunit 3 (subunit A)